MMTSPDSPSSANPPRPGSTSSRRPAEPEGLASECETAAPGPPFPFRGGRRKRAPLARLRLGLPSLDVECVQPVQVLEQCLALTRFQMAEQPLFELQRQGRDLGVDRLSGRAQVQHRPAAILRVHLALQAPGGDQSRHCTADRHLVHRGALGQFAGRQARRQPEHRHHPPLGDPQIKPVGIDPRDRAAEPVRQHGQSIGQELLEFQPCSCGAGACRGGVVCNGHAAPLHMVSGETINRHPPHASRAPSRGDARTLQEYAMSAQPNLGMEVTTFENPMGINGFEFVEFAAPQGEGPRMREYLEKLGFTAVAKHRERAITLFRQGTINFLLNEQPDSFAADFAAKHGPSAAGFAIRFKKKPSEVLEHVLASGGEKADHKPETGAVSFPAIKGIGDCMLYLVDDSATNVYADYEPLPGVDQNPRGFGLTFIDHLTHNLFLGNMQKWSDYYEKL